MAAAGYVTVTLDDLDDDLLEAMLDHAARQQPPSNQGRTRRLI